MPSDFASTPYTQLNLGVELRGLTEGVNSPPGSAQDAVDVLPREDGGIFKHYGWERINAAALTGRPLAVKGFTYKGKNADAGGGETARAGNYGLADTGADFTRRGALYSGCVVLTTSTFYRWDAGSEAFASVSLPGGVSVDPNPKPSILLYNHNLYIVGWATSNLRYDPTDEVLYLWGWEAVPPTDPTNASQSGGDLIVGATYKYAYTFLDIYTGEESGLSDSVSVVPAGSNKTARVSVTQYTGSRHFNTLATTADTDVAIVLYRTDADRETFNFLTVLSPGTTSYDDAGDATEASIHPFQGTMRDEPRFDAIELFRDQFYAITSSSTATRDKDAANFTRVYWNDFSTENSYVERWRVTDYRELPVPEGELLTALKASSSSVVLFTEEGAYSMTAIPNYSSGRVDRVVDRLSWSVGSVGPRAVTALNGWLYFLSKRGPYRWRPGLGEPQWIGKPLSALFLDPTSGLCQLTPGYRRESEVRFDQDANMVRWIFPTGSTKTLNKHVMYWADGDKFFQDPAYGWFFASPRAQCFDYTMALNGLTALGLPPDPVTTTERMVFGDQNGYMYSYEIDSMRAGLPSGSLATGTVVSGTLAVVTLTTSSNPLLTQGDGLKGLRFEIVHSDASIETRNITSNTATAVTLDVPLLSVAAGDTWYVAGIPSFWRSWVDHAGRPHDRKTMLHLYLTYSLTNPDGSAVLDVSVLSGDRGMESQRKSTAGLSDWNEKILISRTGLYFTYEIANSRPDERWMLAALEPELQILGEKRKE